MESEKKYLGSWWVWLVFLMIATGIILTVLSYVGLIGKTVVERVVFEQSMQYTEARKIEIATFEAELAEITHKLSGQLSNEMRNNLESQAAALRIHISVARSK